MIKLEKNQVSSNNKDKVEVEETASIQKKSLTCSSVAVCSKMDVPDDNRADNKVSSIRVEVLRELVAKVDRTNNKEMKTH